VVVKNVGAATAALHTKQTGAIVGLRGPFGTGFSLKPGKTLLVAGGIGIVPLFFAAKKLVSENLNPLCVLGAQIKTELLFKDKLEKMIGREQVILTTEDGSYGDRGLVTTPLQRLLTSKQIDLIYTCGPEKMMRKVFDVAEQWRVPLEASLERLMRCAVGLCGSCVIGKYRVCRDGPVFTSKQLRSINDFGNYQRDLYGKRIPIT
jgi:dihydroorotate dehydrogenase electron transfer subunit